VSHFAPLCTKGVLRIARLISLLLPGFQIPKPTGKYDHPWIKALPPGKTRWGHAPEPRLFIHAHECLRWGHYKQKDISKHAATHTHTSVGHACLSITSTFCLQIVQRCIHGHNDCARYGCCLRDVWDSTWILLHHDCISSPGQGESCLSILPRIYEIYYTSIGSSHSRMLSTFLLYQELDAKSE